MLDLPEQLVPFRTMQVDVIPQGCLETHASYRCCKPGIQLTGHPEPPIKEAIRRPAIQRHGHQNGQPRAAIDGKRLNQPRRTAVSPPFIPSATRGPAADWMTVPARP